MLLIPSGEEGSRICQSAKSIRSVSVFVGKDSKDNVLTNLEDIFRDINHLEKHGVRYCKEKDTFVNQVGPNGERAAKQPGDRDLKIRCILPADMAAHAGLFGQGGTHDKRFCPHCSCHTDQRHAPFKVIRTEEAATVEDLAKKHTMHASTLWMLNAGRDFSGMFTPDDLSQGCLAARTEANPVQGAAPPPAPTADQGMHHDRSSGPAKRKRAGAPQPKTKQDPVSPWFAENKGATEADFAKLVVPPRTYVRVMKSHAMDRASPHLGEKLNLERVRYSSSLSSSTDVLLQGFDRFVAQVPLLQSARSHAVNRVFGEDIVLHVPRCWKCEGAQRCLS